MAEDKHSGTKLRIDTISSRLPEKTYHNAYKIEVIGYDMWLIGANLRALWNDWC